jgi:hypothetical protein
MRPKYVTFAVGLITVLVIGVPSTTLAQTAEPEHRWSFDVGFGWDNGITGNINTSGIGEINNQVVVITKNSYNDVYGAGLHLRVGGGYVFRENTEARVTFTFQSLDADFVVPMGDIGVSNLYGQYSDYQSLSLDFGLRRYAELRPRLRAYGEAFLGIGFVDKTDVTLVAPGANLTGDANDFYDQTAAFTTGANLGAIFQTNEQLGVFIQLGLRYVSGMAEIDNLVGTGLDNINDKSARWTMPFVAGIQYRF